MHHDYLVEVCDACGCACCWQGDFMCDEASSAGTVKRRASYLRKQKLEHSSWFSRARLEEVCGGVEELEVQRG